MTATDELRRMLDERGVEWENRDGFNDWKTRWEHGGATCIFIENKHSGYTDFEAYRLTPEQAIEATLGRGTCHDCLGDIEPFECSECHRRNDTNKFPNYCWYCGVKVVGE